MNDENYYEEYIKKVNEVLPNGFIYKPTKISEIGNMIIWYINRNKKVPIKWLEIYNMGVKDEN